MGEVVGGCMSGGGEVKRKEGGTWVVGKKGKKKEKKKKGRGERRRIYNRNRGRGRKKME
jgi:hypothetical protein